MCGAFYILHQLSKRQWCITFISNHHDINYHQPFSLWVLSLTSITSTPQSFSDLWSNKTSAFSTDCYIHVFLFKYEWPPPFIVAWLHREITQLWNKMLCVLYKGILNLVGHCWQKRTCFKKSSLNSELFNDNLDLCLFLQPVLQKKGKLFFPLKRLEPYIEIYIHPQLPGQLNS